MNRQRHGVERETETNGDSSRDIGGEEGGGRKEGKGNNERRTGHK